MNAEGTAVRFLYRGTLADGTVFDDCEGEPHEIVIGRHQVMRPLEEALAELSPGEELMIPIAADDAYGPYREDAVQTVPTYRIPDGDKLPVGETIAWRTPKRAEPIPAKVLAVEGNAAILDFNHPLAGKDITYWVKRL